VRDLGVYLDVDVTMKTHVTAVARMCFAALRLVRSVRRSLPRHDLLTLIRALVISKIDYTELYSPLNGSTQVMIRLLLFGLGWYFRQRWNQVGIFDP